jgi:poly-gamma-glutamate capsule biosynthesis protein CapA/YwtB (metallophosphatase superfamily)
MAIDDGRWVPAMTYLGLTGDVMLGRLVDRYVFGSPGMRADYVWGDLIPLFHRMDLRLVNLECVIASSGMPWTWTPKAFHFRARPRAVATLREARIDFAGLANNHILDFDVGALKECVGLLDGSAIKRAGAGMTLAEASAPAILSAEEFPCAVIAVTDNEPEWAADLDRPGVNFIDFDEHGLRQPYLSRMEETIAAARRAAGLVVVCAHVGPNWGRPSPAMRAAARQFIDLGADVYWGHSNHTTQGIELYRGRPILYSCGDFVNDYAIEPDERNDLSFFFEIQIVDAVVRELRLHPVRIDRFQVNRATGSDAAWIRRWMEERCAAMGTHVERKDDGLRIEF